MKRLLHFLELSDLYVTLTEKYLNRIGKEKKNDSQVQKSFFQFMLKTKMSKTYGLR